MTSLEKIEFLRALQAEPISSIELRIAINGKELPPWLSVAFTPEFRKDFPKVLQVIEKSLKTGAENELTLASDRLTAELEKLKQALKDLKRNGGA